MTKSKVAKYVVNTALLAVMAAAGIGAYQLGTSISEEKTEEKYPSYYDESMTTEIVTDDIVDAGTSQVEAEIETDSILAENNNLENTQIDQINDTADYTSEILQETLDTENAEDSISTSANAQTMQALSFSEDTLMEWPVNGTLLLDYNMDQTVYHPTLDQYKLSPAIAVQAVEDAPVLASVAGTVYSIEENAQTGITVTMEIGSGYQAIYGQLKDLTVEEGDTVEEGTVIGYIASPTKYYSKEGSNLYFAMKKNGESIDPIAYLP